MTTRPGLPARLWDMQRFGLTPRKLFARLRRTGPGILVLSLPKAGTHLIERALCLHPGVYRPLRRTLVDDMDPNAPDLDPLLARLRPGALLIAHLVHSVARDKAIADRGVKALFMIRDPRDMVISQAFYISRSPWHRLHPEFQAAPGIADQIRLAITGLPSRGWPPLAERLAAYSGWLESEAKVVRFEDLIGPRGGGSVASQAATLGTIFEFLGLPTEEAQLAAICRRVFSSASPTFREGRVGGWRHHLRETDLKSFFHSEAGECLDTYGYR